jgi:hypothetical protein
VDTDISCDTVAARTSYLDNTVFSLSPAVSPGDQTQTGGGYVTWTNVADGTYTISGVPPTADYVLKNACYSKTAAAPWTQSSSVTVSSGDDVTWNLGYGPPGAWLQTQGGDVYALGIIKSYIPAGASPQKFNLDGEGGYPGFVTYGATSSGFDFDAGTGTGDTFVSSKDWLVNETHADSDFYTYYLSKFGNPTTPIASPMTAPTASGTYVTTGDAVIDSAWSVAAGKSYVIFVDGSLTINAPITIATGGFVTFIASGDIEIDPAVGRTFDNDTPVIQGIYMTDGTFHTGTSGAGTERFVGKGMVIAHAVSFERDLGDIHNTTHASELFLYDPELFMRMPDAMKTMPIVWQEVAP